jgi:large subunit ribosomal protein L18
MARGPRYKVAFRRRREGKTDYYLRRKFIVSRKPRLVVRQSLKHMVVQVVEASLPGDKVLVSAYTKELVKDYGWKQSTGNLPAAYLVGYLAGFKAVKAGFDEAIMDVGVQIKKSSRLFAVLKGAVDAGLRVPHTEKIIPLESRIRGEHIATYAEQLLNENPELYKRQWGKVLEQGSKPEDIVEDFENVKKVIEERFA